MHTEQPSVKTENQQHATSDLEAAAVDGIGSLDTTFELLKNSRRRLVLQYLRQSSQPVSLSDLAERIAATENGIDRAQLGSQQRKRVYISLYQCHLPKMDDVGAIRFDQNRGTISLTENAEPLYEYLDGASEQTTAQQPTPSVRGNFAAALVIGTAYIAAMVAGATVIASIVVFLSLSWFVLGPLSE